MVALLLLAPAVLFVLANVLEHELGLPALAEALGPLAEPTGGAEALVTAVVLLGPLAAIALALPVLRLRLERRGETLEAMISVRLRGAHLAVALASAAVLAVLLLYLAAENHRCWLGPATSC